MSMVHEFYITGTFNVDLNVTNIVLIPKKKVHLLIATLDRFHYVMSL